MTRVGRVAVALVLIGTLAGGCSGDDKRVPLGSPDRPSPTVEASPSFATDYPVQALLGWFDAVYEAERTLNPNHPALTRYGQGPALADIRARIARFRAAGVRLDKPNIVENPAISASGKVRGMEVREVTACVIEPAENFVDVKTGEPKSPSGAAPTKQVTLKFVGVMVQTAAGWRIDGSRVEDVATCASVR